MKLTLLKVALALVLALALLVPMAGCGDKGGKDTAPPVETGQYGGVLDYYLLAYPAGWDMHRKVSMSPFVTIAVFNNLVRMDPLKSIVTPGNVKGDLAESWEVSADGLTWTFFLHEGVKWHDGVAFTADDVIYSMEKMMDPERSSVSTYFSTLDQVIKVDDYTVKMVLGKSSPEFLLALAVGYTSIQPKHLAAVDYKSTDFLVGTGPFKFKTTVAGVNLELERNPDYFKEDDKGNQLPYLDGLNIHVISDRSAQMNAFLSERLDMMTPGLGITNQDQYTQFTATQPEGAVLDVRNPPTGPSTWFNFNFEPFQDVRVRQAMALLFDREQFAIAAYGSTEFSNLGSTFFSEPFSIGKERIDEIREMDKPYEERVAKAQKLMADAGYADGFTIRLPQVNMTESNMSHTWLADMWTRHLNIKVESTVYDRGQYFEVYASGEWDVASGDLRVYVPDPNQMMAFFLCGSPVNTPNICDPELDAMWQEQSTVMDIDERVKLTRAIEDKIISEAYAMPSAANRRYHVQWNWVKGFVQQDQYYHSEPSFERTWLDKSLMPAG